jgi:acetylornithine deacetylase/succinyl-diaminopimelate desuccinylase-like protein
MSEAIDRYVTENESRFLEELKELLRIPSISTLPENKDATHRAAGFVVDELWAAGFPHVELIETDRHPLVYAEWLHSPGKPTVLCYGHYDVQPPDPLELWESPPFEPTERNGDLYARGAADDKGQMFSHIKALEAIRAVYGKPPVNVKVLIEGEEEVGGQSVAEYVAANTQKLKADVALVSDTEMYAPGLPTLNIGLRGLVYMEIEARGPMRDLHSGLYGGAAPNAVFGLVELLSKAKDSAGRIQIPHIYDDVEPPSAEEKESWRHLPFDEREYLKTEVGSTELTGEKEYSVFERTWARPTFEVHGIAGGFTGVGAKTVIPARAVAKVSIRLVPKQDPEKVIRSVEQFVKENTPKGIQCDVRVLSAGPGLMVNTDHPAIRVAAKAFSDIFARPTVFTRSGGSIPIVGDFAQHLGIPTILMGFGLPDDGLHSPNEKYHIRNYFDGIRTLAHFFEEYGKDRVVANQRQS